MEKEIIKTSGNAYSETNFSENVPTKKMLHPFKIFLIVFILFVVIPAYCFFSFIGLFPVPKTVIIANFYLNKKHFERIVNSEYLFDGYWTSSINADSVREDKDLQKSINVLFNANIWDHMNRKNLDNFCIFVPYNFTYARGRGILYCEGKDESWEYYEEYGRYVYTYRCESLGDGWYYYNVVYQEKMHG